MVDLNSGPLQPPPPPPLRLNSQDSVAAGSLLHARQNPARRASEGIPSQAPILPPRKGSAPLTSGRKSFPPASPYDYVDSPPALPSRSFSRKSSSDNISNESPDTSGGSSTGSSPVGAAARALAWGSTSSIELNHARSRVALPNQDGSGLEGPGKKGEVQNVGRATSAASPPQQGDAPGRKQPKVGSVAQSPPPPLPGRSLNENKGGQRGAVAERDSGIKSSNQAKIDGDEIYSLPTEGPDLFEGLAPGLPRINEHELTIIGKIGTGIFDVLLARWRGTSVAVKVATAVAGDKREVDLSESSRSSRELRREVEILNRVRHPNVVQLLACTKRALVLEFVPGGSLFEQLSSEAQISRRQRIQYAVGIAKAMCCLHLNDPPIMHLDLKSLNVLVGTKEEGTVKVCDFGLAKDLREGVSLASCVGTVQWMAPELIKGKADYDTSVDVFSFGILLWEICSGQPPYLGVKEDQVKAGVVNGLRPVIPESCPRKLVELITECWQDCPEDRPTFTQCLERLERMMNEDAS